MAKILKTPEGKVVRINTKTDVCLYNAPHNPPNTGTSYTTGVDLYAHKARSGQIYFYKYAWSMWQGESSSTWLITKEAIDFVLDKMQGGYWDCPTNEEIETAKEYFGEFDKETA